MRTCCGLSPIPITKKLQHVEKEGDEVEVEIPRRKCIPRMALKTL